MPRLTGLLVGAAVALAAAALVVPRRAASEAAGASTTFITVPTPVGGPTGPSSQGSQDTPGRAGGPPPAPTGSTDKSGPAGDVEKKVNNSGGGRPEDEGGVGGPTGVDPSKGPLDLTPDSGAGTVDLPEGGQARVIAGNTVE